MSGLEVFNLSFGLPMTNSRVSHLLQGQLPIHTLTHMLLGIRFLSPWVCYSLMSLHISDYRIKWLTRCLIWLRNCADNLTTL